MNFRQTLAHLFHPRRSNNHRPRVLHPEALLYLAAVVVTAGFLISRTLPSVSQTTGAVLGYASDISVGQAVDMTNQQRQQQGLNSLSVSPALSQAAIAKANDMFSKQYWAHTSPDGTEPWDFIANAGYDYTVAGENLARDFSNTGEMIDAWMNSPTHRANIVHQRYTEIGIGVVNGVLDGVETTLVVQMFGAPPTQAVARVLEETQQRAVTEEPAEQPTQPARPVPTAAPVVIEEVPEETTTLVAQEEPEPSPVSVLPAPTADNQAVLSGMSALPGSLRPQPQLSPLIILKALFLAVILLVGAVLVYDYLVIGHRHTMRLVGKNTAHIMLLLVVAYIIIFFNGGVIG